MAIAKTTTTEPKDLLSTPNPEPAQVESAPPSGDVVLLFDTTMITGLNTVRLDVAVPRSVKTQDGQATTYTNVTFVPGLQIKTAQEWAEVQQSPNQIAREALTMGALRQEMGSLEEFDNLRIHEALDLIKKCIDESSVKLLETWLTGSLAAKNKVVRDALESHYATVKGADSFAQAKQMMPVSSN